MTDDDVSGDDMTTHEFSDDDAEAIISGFAPRDPELGAALDDLRSSFAAVDPPTVSGALNEFIVRGADPVSVPAGAAAVPIVEPLVDTTPTRRHPVFASLSAFAGTALGKLCIGASVAAAGVGGATAAGVGTPINSIFDDDDAIVETEDDLLDDDSIELPGIDEPADDEAKRENDDEGDDDLDDADESGDADDGDDKSDESDDDSDDSDDSDDDSDDAGDSDDDTTTTTTPTTTTPTTTTPTTTTTPSTTTTVPTSGGTASVTHTVPGVGTVSFSYDSGSWTLGTVSPAGGYVVDQAYVDGEGPDVTFVDGPVDVDVDVQVEDGQIRVRVRTENDDTDARTEAFFFYPIS